MDLRKFLSKIQSEEARAAFYHLDAIAQAHPDFHPNTFPRGDKATYIFRPVISKIRSQFPFSFISNRGHLLFYIRRLGMKDGGWTLEKVQEFAPQAIQKHGENQQIQIRIETLAQAQALTRALFGINGTQELQRFKVGLTYEVIGRPSRFDDVTLGDELPMGFSTVSGQGYLLCDLDTVGSNAVASSGQARFEGDELHWMSREDASVQLGSAAHDGQGGVNVFYRTQPGGPFIYGGIARAERLDADGAIVWTFADSAHDRPESLAEEVPNAQHYFEGATKQIAVDIYERNPAARRACIQAHGTVCCVTGCGFDFQEMYGEIGAGFIHVHHLRPLSSIRAEHQLDPVADLRPVCPNCHAMLHRRAVPLSIDELSSIIRSTPT